MLRCREGDHAFVVNLSSSSPLLGMIVKCHKFVGEHPQGPRNDYWDVGFALIADISLLPIRPQRADAIDEMLVLLGRPEGEVVPIQKERP